MQESFKDQLSSIINNIEFKKTTKQERINTKQTLNQVNPLRKSMPLIWRIVRNENKFNKFNIIETSTNKTIEVSIDLEEAQEAVDLHNSQTEKYWEAAVAVGTVNKFQLAGK